jgi:uncharacterized membrane protein
MALALGASAFLLGRIASDVEIAFVGFLGTVAGVLMSAYLTYVEAFVLDAWCSYCIVSALLMTGLFAAWGLLLLLSMHAGHAGDADRTRRLPYEKSRARS